MHLIIFNLNFIGAIEVPGAQFYISIEARKLQLQKSIIRDLKFVGIALRGVQIRGMIRNNEIFCTHKAGLRAPKNRVEVCLLER